MIFSKKENPKQEIVELKRQIEISKMAIASAQNQFEHVIDPTLIDCYIYEINALLKRYSHLSKLTSLDTIT